MYRLLRVVMVVLDTIIFESLPIVDTTQVEGRMVTTTMGVPVAVRR